jgi:hypothetical protein
LTTGPAGSMECLDPAVFLRRSPKAETCTAASFTSVGRCAIIDWVPKM